MQLSVSKLANRTIQPITDAEIPDISPIKPDQQTTGHAADTRTLENKVSDPLAPPYTDDTDITSPADFPRETEVVEILEDFNSHQKGIEQGLLEAATDQQVSGFEQPALAGPAAESLDLPDRSGDERPKARKGWSKAAYGHVESNQPTELLDADAKLKRTRHIPALKGLPNSRDNRRLSREGRIYQSQPLANAIFREQVWDKRTSHFTDFYADPAAWPEPLIKAVIEWYKQGICLREILGRLVKQRNKQSSLPPFTLSHLGSLRLIDIYAVLATCVYIGKQTAFVGDPSYQQFAITEARQPIISEEHPGDTELPLDAFLYAYKVLARLQHPSWVEVANELATSFNLNQLQVRYTFRQQLSKSIRRRLLDIRKHNRVAFDPNKAGRALLAQAEKYAIGIRHGDQVIAILPWPKPSELPLSSLPGEHLFPLAYLIEAVKSLGSRLDEPAHDVLQHLRNLLSTYRTENRPAVVSGSGTLTGAMIAET